MLFLADKPSRETSVKYGLCQTQFYLGEGDKNGKTQFRR
jgi:hypothetical protein